MPLTVGVVRERAEGESRVATVPEVVDKFTAAGASVLIEAGAGERARIPDSVYEAATMEGSAERVLGSSDVLLK
ncbi:MAG: NAD(P)(+) transhydrogenase (Re/Si-specific) subunit alpha, partial [Armatimonadetes bacterium]|nr:NAD(P)(+) transhydrogenase (Re/Si-specific) subunit alpha [Armatimonadota bacterium]